VLAVVLLAALPGCELFINSQAASVDGGPGRRPRTTGTVHLEVIAAPQLFEFGGIVDELLKSLSGAAIG
jgi:hypothetical protein